MKMILFLFLLISTLTVFSQEIDLVEKVSKKCSVFAQNDLYGLMVNNKVVQVAAFEEYEYWNKLIIFHNQKGSVCWNDLGEKVLEFSDAQAFSSESPNYIFVLKDNGQMAVYTHSGKEIVPFAKQEYTEYYNGIVILRADGNSAFFDRSGNLVLPFSDMRIEILDEYNNILGVRDQNGLTILLNEMVSLPKESTAIDAFTFAKNKEVTVGEYITFLGNQKFDGYLQDQNSAILDVTELFPDTTQVESKLRPLYRYVLNELAQEEPLDLSLRSVALTTTEEGVTVPFKIGKEFKDVLNYPVTGISKEQAEYYCSWLNLIQQEWETDEYANMVDYRLPSASEWETIANQGLRAENKVAQVPDSLNPEKCMLFVFKNTDPCKNYASYLKASKGGGSVPVTAPPIDLSGRSHVFGNVAEMTNEEGIAKGGSFAQPAVAAKASNTIEYNAPEPWLGFRIVGQYIIR